MLDSTLNVLVVDDITAKRDETTSILLDYCENVSSCSSLEEAFKHLEQSKTNLIMASVGAADFRRLVELTKEFDFTIQLLFQPKHDKGTKGSLYLCAVSLSSLKQSSQLLKSTGDWWELNDSASPVHERYRKLLNRVSEGILDVGPNDRIRWANNAFKAMVGEDNLVGVPIIKVIDHDDRACLASIFTQIKNGIIAPFLVRTRQGGIVEVDSTPHFAPDGAYLGSVALVRPANDIPENEFDASRQLSGLYSLALQLNSAFEINDVVEVITNTIRTNCGYRDIGIKVFGENETSYIQAEGFISKRLRSAIDTFCKSLGDFQKIRVIKDVDRDPDPVTEEIRTAGYQGIICVPFTAGTKRIGCVWALVDDKKTITREKSSYLISLGIQSGMALQNALHVQSRLIEEANRRHFYRDALYCLTSGKLVFCEYDELDSHWKTCGDESVNIPLNGFEDVPKSRHLAESCMHEQGFNDDRLFDMVTCVSEGATNVVKYGPPGELRIKANSGGVSIRLDDVGPGIPFANLPKAVLLSGYSNSTAPSLGLGYSVMLELCDCVHLASGAKGTSLILEMIHKTADPLDAFVGFAHAVN